MYIFSPIRILTIPFVIIAYCVSIDACHNFVSETCSTLWIMFFAANVQNIQLIVTTQNQSTFNLFLLVYSSMHISYIYKNEYRRVSHNQGYHLVCTWGQKWRFLHCPKNNCTWKSIDYSVWNPNFAKLSLIFIEIYKFENPSLTRHCRVGGAIQCWHDIHFYWVLLMIIFNWTY